MGKENVAFRGLAAFDHHLNNVSRTYADPTSGIRELRERRYAIGFVANIDKDVGAGDFKNPAFEDLVPRRRGKVAVVVQKMLIFFGI